MISLGRRFLNTSYMCKKLRAHFKNCQVKTHVQTARESHDLNMDYRSFDNGFKQLCVKVFMQEYRDHTWFLCINMCGAPSLRSRLKVDRPGVITSPEGPAKVNTMEQICVIVIYCIFYLIPAPNSP